MSMLSLEELARHCGAVVEGDGSRRIAGPAPLSEAGPDQVSFLADPRHRRHLETTRAGGVLVGPGIARVRADLTFLRCGDPSGAFTRVVELFARPRGMPEVGVHPTAVVDASARLATGARIGAFAVIGSGAVLSEGVVVHPGVVIGERALVGEQTELHPRVVLYHGVQIGRRCVVHAGTVIGSDGFGFEPSESGWRKVPQLGIVIVGDDVEIGANVTIDRGRFGPTRIGNGVKIDNLVHVGHNVDVGDHSLLIAQVGIAGSTRIGPNAILAGGVGVRGHIEIGTGARIAGGSLIYKSVPPGEERMPLAAFPKVVAMRAHGFLSRLPALNERLAELERRLDSLEGRDGPERQP